jgi:SAM-dependent methyltransferase
MARVLEVGCGLSSFFHDFHPAGDHVKVTDVYPSRLNEVEASYRRLSDGGDVHFQRADGTRLPYKDGEFDTVIMKHVFSSPATIIMHGKTDTSSRQFEKWMESTPPSILRRALLEKAVELEPDWLEELSEMVGEAHMVLKPGGRLLLVAEEGSYGYNDLHRKENMQRIHAVLDGHPGFTPSDEHLRLHKIPEIERTVGYRFRPQSPMLQDLIRADTDPKRVDIHVFTKRQ